MSPKVLPMGMDSFRRLRQEGCYYVDKTMMIADFLGSGCPVTLITRPRGFGKTLNLDMLREFLISNTDSRDIFAGLVIMDTPFRKCINSYPVLSFSFCGCKGDKATLISMVKSVLYQEYRRYDEVGAALSGMDKEDYIRVLQSLQSRDADLILINRAIAYLCELVSCHEGVNPHTPD